MIHPARTRTPSQYTLLAEVELGFPGRGLSPLLEIIDLPGLGARLESDDQLTLTYLPRLHGALIFQSTEQVKTKEAYSLLAKLQENYRRLKGRVWLVVTKFDSLSGEHRNGDSLKRTILDHLNDTLSYHHIPPEQVLLVGNEFYKRLNEEGRDKTAMYRELLNLEISPEGDPVMPEKFGRHAQMAKAFEEVMHDGGIDRIRRVIGESLAQEVQEQVRRSVREDLREIARELAALVERAKDRAAMDRPGFDNAMKWMKPVAELAASFENERPIL